jgi:hypothetical protein
MKSEELIFAHGVPENPPQNEHPMNMTCLPSHSSLRNNRAIAENLPTPLCIYNQIKMAYVRDPRPNGLLHQKDLVIYLQISISSRLHLIYDYKDQTFAELVIPSKTQVLSDGIYCRVISLIAS